MFDIIRGAAPEGEVEERGRSSSVTYLSRSSAIHSKRHAPHQRQAASAGGGSFPSLRHSHFGWNSTLLPWKPAPRPHPCQLPLITTRLPASVEGLLLIEQTMLFTLGGLLMVRLQRCRRCKSAIAEMHNTLREQREAQAAQMAQADIRFLAERRAVISAKANALLSI